MNARKLIPLLVLGGIGYYWYKQHKATTAAASSATTPAVVPIPNVKITSAPLINTAGMQPVTGSTITPLSAPPAPSTSSGFWAGVLNYLPNNFP